MAGSGDDERERLLAMLNERCGRETGVVAVVKASDDDDESSSDIANDDEEGWAGIQQDEGSTSTLAENVVVYMEHARDTNADSERDPFMSSKVRSAPINSKGKGRATNQDAAEDIEEEKHLKTLDKSLASLISNLPSKASGISSILPSLATLPDPRYTTRNEQRQSNIIDKRAPRILREKLYSARLDRAQKKAAEDREAGIISAKGDRDGRYALTKKRRREQTGDEDRRRKSAKGLGGVVGKMRKGGSVLTLSRDEIRKGGEGDLEGIAARKRRR